MINNNNIHKYNNINISVSIKPKITDSKDEESGLFHSVSQENDISKMAIELKINRNFLAKLIEKLRASVSEKYAKTLEERLDFATKFVSMVLTHEVLPERKQELINCIRDFPDLCSRILNKDFQSWCMNPASYSQDQATQDVNLQLLASHTQDKLIISCMAIKDYNDL